jgi:predicted nuclease of predicted toxin-antitoxin system
LRTEGHDVLESRDLGRDPGDQALLEVAREGRRILVTIDTDFGALVHREGAQHTGLVRLPDVPASIRIELLQQVLDRHSDALLDGALVTVRGTRIRVSRQRD